MDFDDAVFGGLTFIAIVAAITLAFNATGCVKHGEEQKTLRCQTVAESTNDVRVIHDVCGDTSK